MEVVCTEVVDEVCGCCEVVCDGIEEVEYVDLEVLEVENPSLQLEDVDV